MHVETEGTCWIYGRTSGEADINRATFCAGYLPWIGNGTSAMEVLDPDKYRDQGHTFHSSERAQDKDRVSRLSMIQ